MADILDNDVKNKEREKKELMSILVDKAQKLVGALYRVTDLFSDKEPLKWSLRERAVLIMNNIMSVTSPVANFRDRSIVFEEIKESIGQMEKILDVVSFGAYTSSLNFDILKNEYKKLLAMIEGDKELITSEMLLMISEAVSKETKEINKSENHNGHKGQDAVAKRTLPSNTNVHYENNPRAAKIMDFFKNKENGTVRDIASIFNGVSEKTIQRDLLALAAAGKLLAKGEKRWRTYSLKNPAIHVV